MTIVIFSNDISERDIFSDTDTLECRARIIFLLYLMPLIFILFFLILLHHVSRTQPLSARRNEHERCRKQIKETWHRELKRMQESVGNLRKAKALYVQRQQEWERAKEAAQRAESAAESSTEQASKLDKRKKTEEDALQKVKPAHLHIFNSLFSRLSLFIYSFLWRLCSASRVGWNSCVLPCFAQIISRAFAFAKNTNARTNTLRRA